MIKKASLVLLILLLFNPAVRADDFRRDIHFPDAEGYQTLACDLHMHTVFSDGQVWPTVRVVEAWRQGLDAISITDHIEYQPHKDDVPTNHNRPYELAAGLAKAHGVLLARGAEITRDTPPGHFNAIFLTDVNPLDAEDLLEVLKRANEQGAFVFWNHHEWKGPEKGQWMDIHSTMYENKWLHGMEVANGDTYYPTAHQWCLDKNLTMIGSSDIHEPDLRKRNTMSDHRTMTLAFVKERTLSGLKEALREGRTVVWYKDQLIGRKEWLERLFAKCVQVSPPNSRSGRNIWVQIRNVCDTDIQLEPASGSGLAPVVLPARSTKLLKLDIGEATGPVQLKYMAVNFLIAPETGLPVILEIPD